MHLNDLVIRRRLIRAFAGRVFAILKIFAMRWIEMKKEKKKTALS